MAEESSSGIMEDDSGLDTSSSSTPDLWMLLWLQRHRQGLLDAMQNSVQFIVDYLVEKGHMHDLRSDVYQQIRLETTTPLEKVRKLLDWLSTQPPAVFWTFQHALRLDRLKSEAVHRYAVSDKEMKELVGRVMSMSLPENLNLINCPSVLKAREQLRKSYRSMDKLLMSAGLAKVKTMTMDKILVNICLLSSEEAKKVFEKHSFSSRQDEERSQYLFSKMLQCDPSLVSLEEVFRARRGGEEDPNKVVATGGAGCGKSVCFTRKAPYEWAFGRLWKQFALLFCLELRDKSVWQAKSLAELLKLAQLNLSVKEQEEAAQFITNHPDQVVIVCDGLDEGSVDESGLLWSLLQGKSVGIPSNLRVVVTTRPCSAMGKISKSTSYQGVEVIGFTKEDVALFARKYIGEHAAETLLTLLDKQPSIASMMHVPLFCLLICDLFQEKHRLPMRRTELFEKIVVALLHRYADTHGVEEPFQDLSDAPANLRELVVGLGKIAFQGLQKKQLYFKDVQLKEAGMPMAALELGLLTKSESTIFWKRDEYAFSHLTLQEFLAALYVSSEALQTEADVIELLQKVRFYDGHLSTFWVFLAGVLRGGKLETFLHSVVLALPYEERYVLPRLLEYCRDLLYLCFAESHLGESGTPSTSVGDYLRENGVGFFGTSMLSASASTAMRTVMLCHPANIHNVAIARCRVAESVLSQVLVGLQLCKSVKRLRYSENKCALTSHHLLTLSAVLANSATTLAELEIADNETNLGDNGLEQLFVSLQQCRNLKTLNLSKAALTSRSGAILRNVLICLPDLEVLLLRGNPLGDTGLEQMAEGLQRCKKLKKLHLTYTRLTSRSGSLLRDVTPSLPSLEDLALDMNELGDSSLEQLANGLQLCTNLRLLYIADNTGWSSRAEQVLSRLTSTLPSLSVLRLGSPD